MTWGDELIAKLSAVDIWELFITDEMLDTAVDETKSHKHYILAKQRPKNIPAARQWPPKFLANFVPPDPKLR